MRITVVAADLPHPEGTAVGKTLWAWCEGARALGHDLDAWVWHKSANSPPGPVPEWCTYRPFDLEHNGPMWKEHVYSLLRPRAGLARARWQPPADSVVVADQVPSSPAVEGLERSATVIYYRAAADAWAVRQLRPSVLQDVRAERRAARKPALVLALSQRVARHLRRPAQVVPIAYPVPEAPLNLTEEPVAAMMADWSWPPNRAALARLLEVWPSVREAVPAARLLLAGRKMARDAIGTMPGVRFVGPVSASAEVLAQASVLAFPCPPSSGPKVKVLEALSYGLPVVTTVYGVEGLVLGPGEGAIVARARDFGDALRSLLLSPDKRLALARSGRAAIETHHAPVPAARARVQSLADAFGIKPGAHAEAPPFPPVAALPTR